MVSYLHAYIVYVTSCVCSDFFGYALFELVDNTLSSIHSFVTKKKWMDAWNAILALVLFNSMIGGDWTREFFTRLVYTHMFIRAVHRGRRW